MQAYSNNIKKKYYNQNAKYSNKPKNYVKFSTYEIEIVISKFTKCKDKLVPSKFLLYLTL